MNRNRIPLRHDLLKEAWRIRDKALSFRPGIQLEALFITSGWERKIVFYCNPIDLPKPPYIFSPKLYTIMYLASVKPATNEANLGSSISRRVAQRSSAYPR